MTERRKGKYIKDSVLVVFSIFIALYIAKSPAISDFIFHSDNFYILDSFVAGLFFTSIFTTAPAMVVLGAITGAHSVAVVALVGGLGAMIGDKIILNFLKKHVSSNISDIL